MRLGTGFLIGAAIAGAAGAQFSAGFGLFAALIGGFVGVNLANRGNPRGSDDGALWQAETGPAESNDTGGHGASGSWDDGGDTGGDD